MVDTRKLSPHPLRQSVQLEEFHLHCSCLQNNASKLLLAVMESRHDSENAERILNNMNPRQLVGFRSLCEDVQHITSGKMMYSMVMGISGRIGGQVSQAAFWENIRVVKGIDYQLLNLKR